MSLKRRNAIAVLMIFLAAGFLTLGRTMTGLSGKSGVSMTTAVVSIDKATTYSSTDTTAFEPTTSLPNGSITSYSDQSYGNSDRYESTTDTSQEQLSQPHEAATLEEPTGRSLSGVGLFFIFAAVAAAVAAVFVLWQKEPIFGPDGASLLFVFSAAIYYISQNIEYIIVWRSMGVGVNISTEILITVCVLLGMREVFGWIRGRCSLSWCLAQRIATRCSTPQKSLLVFILCIIISFLGFLGFLTVKSSYRFLSVGFSASTVLAFCCLWKYGTDLDHFKKQLDNYRQGKSISVGDGAFSQTEAQLLEVQAQHEEAVRTAVTGERFKVELISNVSHDLRTPLTSILGYSELLQNEELSPQGREQLRRLYQKAGYMNDLVESLFELTKVSSGVVESKREQIDLIRLLEQTVGLFDDQLASAGLVVKRSYDVDSIQVVTDGARMHQVFANLLGNAIKYALAGTRIYLEVKRTDNSFIIRMMNTASYEMDFKPDEIMQRFARGDKARSTKGSGLGLAIAQTYTESVGGAFRVEVDGDQFSAIVELPKDERNL